MTLPVPRLQGIRGATTVERNDAGEILAATDELLRTLIEGNELQPDDIVSALFTVTRDLDAAFPARAAEEFGWNIVALLHATEIPVPGSLPAVHPAAGARLHPPRPQRNQALLSPGGHGAASRPGVTAARVTARGAERWVRGHPWIYRSDVVSHPGRARPGAGAGPARPVHRPGAALSRVRDPAPAAGAHRPAGGRGVVARAARGRRRPARRHRRHRLPPGARRRRRPPVAGGRSLRPLARGPDPLRRPGDRCGRRILEALVSLLPARGHPAPQRRAGPRGARGCRRGRAGLRHACRGRSRSARGSCGTSRRPGTDRRPAPSSTSAPTGCSPAEITRPGGPRARLLRLSRLLRPAPGGARRRA